MRLTYRNSYNDTAMKVDNCCEEELIERLCQYEDAVEAFCVAGPEPLFEILTLAKNKIGKKQWRRLSGQDALQRNNQKIIQILREYLGISQDELALHIGVSPITISRWETLRERVSPESVLKPLCALAGWNWALFRVLVLGVPLETAAKDQEEEFWAKQKRLLLKEEIEDAQEEEVRT